MGAGRPTVRFRTRTPLEATGGRAGATQRGGTWWRSSWKQRLGVGMEAVLQSPGGGGGQQGCAASQEVGTPGPALGVNGSGHPPLPVHFPWPLLWDSYPDSFLLLKFSQLPSPLHSAPVASRRGSPLPGNPAAGHARGWGCGGEVRAGVRSLGAVMLIPPPARRGQLGFAVRSGLGPVSLGHFSPGFSADQNLILIIV